VRAGAAELQQRVPEQPDLIVLTRHRDLVGRRWHPAVRRGLLALVFALLVLALLNVFGQRPATSRAATRAAVLSVYSPSTVRGGLLYTARFHVTARTDLPKVQLVLAPGWFEGMQVNSTVPQPISEGSDNGQVVFDLGHLGPGKSSIVWVQFQVNPTNVGHRSQDVLLTDGKHELLHIDRTITVFP
jgi:hypothetical protein